MKYYAVTEDPNELMHFGIKGMKWGVRRSDAQLGHPRHSGPRRPRSLAYKKAQAKLSASMRNGIAKVETKWKEHNSPENKALRAYKKSEKSFQKHMEKARKGTLKYKGISDAEVERITDRLALERNSRALSGTEKPSYLRRLREAAGTGIVEGVARGTSAYMEERWRGRGRTTADIKRDKRMAKYEGRDDVLHRKAKKQIDEEYYKTAYEEGANPNNYKSTSRRAKYLADVKKRNKESDYRASIQKVYDEQTARSRAVSDRQRDDWRRNAILNEVNSGSRRLQSSGAWQRLEAQNRAKERANERKYWESGMEQIKKSDAAKQARLDATYENAVRNTSNRRKRKGRN